MLLPLAASRNASSLRSHPWQRTFIVSTLTSAPSPLGCIRLPPRTQTPCPLTRHYGTEQTSMTGLLLQTKRFKILQSVELGLRLTKAKRPPRSYLVPGSSDASGAQMAQSISTKLAIACEVTSRREPLIPSLLLCPGRQYDSC